MDTSEAIDITNAVILLAKLFNETPSEFASSLCLFHEYRLPLLNEAIQLREKFEAADIVERGKLLGVKITKVGNNYESTILLSDNQDIGE